MYDVRRGHQASNRLLGVAKQRERDRALLRCQERKELTGRGRGQLIEQGGAVVRGHGIENGGHLLVRHPLEQQFLRILREVLEHGRGVPAWKHAEDHHLIVGAELHQKRRRIAGMTSAHDRAHGRVLHMRGAQRSVRRRARRFPGSHRNDPGQRTCPAPASASWHPGLP